MAIFEIRNDALVPVQKADFASTGLRERADLQRLLRDQIDVVAPGVLVIAEEFGEWTDSRRRIDLLGIDERANLVVIELKRTEVGGHMELQALRYAAMVSTLTAERAIEIFGEYLTGRGIDDDPEQQILEFLGWADIDEDAFAQDVRMVLVSADFSRELTTTVIWLNEKELDVRCVRIRPYSYDGKVLIDVQQVVPLPEAADYQVSVREKKRQERASRESSADFTRYDVTVNGNVYRDQWKRNSILLVVKALADVGVSIREIRELFSELGRGTVFFELPGRITSADEFISQAQELVESESKRFNPQRWHLREEDLLADGNDTFVFSNQWGRHWPKFMKELKSRYPQIGLDYSPTPK